VVEVRKTKGKESKRPAYLLDVVKGGGREWRGAGCRPDAVMGVPGLALVRSEGGRLRVGDWSGLVRRGDLVWLGRGDQVEVKAQRALGVLVVYFDLRWEGERDAPWRESGLRRLRAGVMKKVVRAFEGLVEAFKEQETLGDRVLAWGYAAQLLGLAIAREEGGWRGATGGRERETLRHVLGFIESRMAQRLDLPILAGVAGLSRTHFAQWFRQRVGQSPMRYVRERRVERAKVLLTSTDLTVEQVAGQVGFKDPAHFNRVFKNVVGVPPLRHARGRGK
jgi:AraC-like DNA-binding protein